MLTDNEKSLIRESMGALKQSMPGFKSRRAQLEMIGAVATAFGNCYEPEEEIRRGRSIAVIEAGTGVGKTAGYLIPAIVLSKSRGKHLVISSSTVALQQQISQKDAPLLQSLVSVNFTFAVAKGRGRYACSSKLMALADEAAQEEIDFTAKEGTPPPKSLDATRDNPLIVDMADRLFEGSWNGDRDNLNVPIPDSVWSTVTTDRQGCGGKKCPQFANCPFYVARKEVREADVVIANHDLVLAALGMDAGTVLPDPGDTFYVFDEAHSLPKKVMEHFAGKHSIRGASEWVRDVGEVVRDIVLGLSIDVVFQRDAIYQSQTLNGYLEDLFRAINGTRAFEEKRCRRFINGALPEWGITIGAGIFSSAKDLQRTLQKLREVMLEKSFGEAHLVQHLLSNLGFYLGKLENLVDTWDLLLADDMANGSPTARWIEKYESTSDKNDYLICASPLSGGDKLRFLLWDRASAVILTSATLTSCGSFHLFMEQTGLSRMPEKTSLQVESPFNYAEKAKLVIPSMRTDPKNATAHTKEVIERLPGLITTHGTLALFASGKQMRDVYAEMPEHLRQNILMQGALPKMELIARHKKAIDKGDRSIIFGLSSFSEGVDLPYDYCTHVIISKLPFTVPDSPLEEARREWIEKQGRSAFMEISVPEAGIRLSQSVGRLLRTDDDFGTVTVLDKRLITKRWGALLLKGLPPFALVIGSKQIARVVPKERT